MKEKLNVRLAFGLGLGLVFLATTLAVARHATLPLATAGLGAAQIVAGCMPAVLFLATPPGRRGTVPLLALSGLFYATFFGFPVFLAHILRHPESGEIVAYRSTAMAEVSTGAQLLALAGLLCFYAGFGLSRRLRRVWAPRALRAETDFSGLSARLLAWGLLVAYAAYLYFPALRQLPSVGQFLQPAGLVAVGLIFVLWRRGRLSLPEKALFAAGLMPFIIVSHFTATLLTPLVLIGALVLALELWLSGRLPWRAVTLATVVFVVVYPAMTPVRERLWTSPGQLALTEKIGASFDALGDFLGGRLPGGAGGYRGFTTRVGQIFVLSYVYEQTPKAVPFWNGETYKPLFTSFIPRALWPSKPRETVGGQFGRRYGITEAGDETSVNLPWLTEAFVNFGVWGAILGMTLAGMLIGLLERFYCHRGLNDTGTVVGAGITLPLFFQESNFSLMVGSLLPLTVCMIVYFAVGRRVLGKLAGDAS
jgi:hypothetical protein